MRTENKVRHDGYPSYIDFGAWLTKHQSGNFEQDGNACTWHYFIKIKAAPDGAFVDTSVWHSSDGGRIGSVIWGEFAIVQSVFNDGCVAAHGIEFIHKPGSLGLGN